MPDIRQQAKAAAAPPRGVFGILGMTEEEEQVYAALVEHPGATIAGVAEAAALAPAQTRAALDALEARGLVERSVSEPDGYLPLSPEAALDEPLRARARELEVARQRALELTDRLRNAVAPGGFDHIIQAFRGLGATKERWLLLVASAREEALTMDRPPYLPRLGIDPPEVESAEGRILVDQSTLAIPGHVEYYVEHPHDGTEVRAVERLPMKMQIVDRRQALVVVTDGGDKIEGCFIVRESELLDSLIALFEATWAAATPLVRPGSAREAQGGRDAPSSVDRRILSLLMVGLTDQGIARALGVSQSTVERRMRALMRKLGATSRFQLGYRAAVNGWLDVEP